MLGSLLHTADTVMNNIYSLLISETIFAYSMSMTSSLPTELYVPCS